MPNKKDLIESVHQGTVEWFNDQLCYGFIKPDALEASDIFFHFSYLQMDGFRTIKKGARVSFEIGENHKGPMAVNIMLLHET